MSAFDIPEGLTLEAIDTDGALQETAERAFPTSRAELFRRAVIGGGTLLSGGLLLGRLAEEADAAGTGRPSDDGGIVNFALTLEYLEAEFYAQALRLAGLPPGRLRTLVITVRNHELAHVRALKGLIGRAALATPRFNFGPAVRSVSAFHSTAIWLEDLGVGAYAGQMARINNAPILNAAARILAVEARHAAAFRQLKGLNPAPLSMDPLKDVRLIKASIGSRHWVQGGAPGIGL